MKSIYVGCSLTDAPREFTDKIERLKKCLRVMGYKVFDFVGLTRGTPNDVYRWDIHNCVAKCDLLLAICDYPSIGLGYELGTAIEKFAKQVLAVADENRQITRFVQGIDHPKFTFLRYRDFDQIAEMVMQIMPPHEQDELAIVC